MISLDNLKVNEKYYVTVKTDYNYEYKLRVVILNIMPKVNPDAPDYVVLRSIENSETSICGYGPISIPLDFIVSAVSLQSILSDVTINDVIYLIDQFV
jgi:hypothetical protein